MDHTLPTILEALDSVWQHAQAAWWARRKAAEAMAAARRTGATDRQVAEASGLSVQAVNAYVRQLEGRPRQQVGQQPPRHRAPGGTPIYRVPPPPPPRRSSAAHRRVTGGPGPAGGADALHQVWQHAQFAFRARLAVAQSMTDARRAGATDEVIAKASGLSPGAVRAYIHQHGRYLQRSRAPGSTTYVGRMPPRKDRGERTDRGHGPRSAGGPGAI